MRRRAFTLVEIMIVILIIGLLLAIAVPQFITARENAQEKACWQNQQKLEAAKISSTPFRIELTRRCWLGWPMKRLETWGCCGVAGG